MVNRKIIISGSLMLCATFMVLDALPGRKPRVSLHVYNDNGHAIVQTNSHAVRVDAMQPPAPVCELPKPSLTSRIMSSIAEHKKTCLLGCLVTGYAALTAALMYMERTMQTCSCWSTWHDETSLSVLLQRDQKELAKELFEVIRQYYLLVSAPTTFLDPIISFMNDCDDEIGQLHRFISWREWMAYTKIAYLLPNQDEAVAQAHFKMDKLRYLKQLLVNWLSEYRAD